MPLCAQGVVGRIVNWLFGAASAPLCIQLFSWPCVACIILGCMHSSGSSVSGWMPLRPSYPGFFHSQGSTLCPLTSTRRSSRYVYLRSSLNSIRGFHAVYCLLWYSSRCTGLQNLSIDPAAFSSPHVPFKLLTGMVKELQLGLPSLLKLHKVCPDQSAVDDPCALCAG